MIRLLNLVYINTRNILRKREIIGQGRMSELNEKFQAHSFALTSQFFIFNERTTIEKSQSTGKKQGLRNF